MTCPACAPHRLTLAPDEELRCAVCDAHCGFPARAPEAATVPAQGATRGSAPPGVVRAAPRGAEGRKPPAGRVYVAGEEDGPPPRPPVHAASGLAPVEDPELVRVRCLLAALRPEAVNPFVKPVQEPTPVPPLRISRAPWDMDQPPGAFQPPAPPPGPPPNAAVLARFEAFHEGERILLDWLCRFATLEKGLPGLYLDLAWAFPPSEETGQRWHSDVSAGRNGGVPYGRHLLQSACEAWGIPSFGRERVG